MEYNLKEIEKSVAGKLYFFDEIDSTNSVALNTVDAPDKSLFLTNRQFEGRGRMKRKWVSDNGEICMTIFLKPSLDISDFSAITLVAGVAVSRVIRNSKIKWPNDIILSGKKVCGILTESRISNKPIFAVGIGINVNNKQFPDYLKDKATSLFIKTGREEDKTDIVISVLKEFWTLYDEFLLNGFTKIKKEYLLKSATVGKEIVIIKDGVKRYGTAAGIENDGSLIADIDGKIEILNSGEVSVRGLLGYN